MRQQPETRQKVHVIRQEAVLLGLCSESLILRTTWIELFLACDKQSCLKSTKPDMPEPELPLMAGRAPNDTKIQGYHFGGSYNKDYSILGSILGSPC